MTARQWADWIAFSNVECWGDTRADLRIALMGSHLSNRWRGKGEAPVSPYELMPYEEKPEQTAEQMQDNLKEILNAASRKA